jgi:predicted ribosome quality control (RQC) complex YloA/Tae2 family protein
MSDIYFLMVSLLLFTPPVIFIWMIIRISKSELKLNSEKLDIKLSKISSRVEEMHHRIQWLSNTLRVQNEAFSKYMKTDEFNETQGEINEKNSKKLDGLENKMEQLEKQINFVLEV